MTIFIRKIFLLFLFNFLSLIVFSQKHHLEIKYVGLGWHPSDEGMNADKMPLKLDEDGTFMLNIGLVGSLERYFKEDGKLSLELMGSYSLDCAMVSDLFFHFGFRGTIFTIGKHSLNGGIGPTILVRRNWHAKIDDYQNLGYFNGDEDDYFQWKFFWYGGDIEYNYAFNERNFLSVSIIPGFPKYVVLFIGYERRIGKSLKTE